MLEELRAKIASNRFEFTRHALDQSILRNITVQEVREAFLECEVIEDYSDDKYGPSCLVFGKTKSVLPFLTGKPFSNTTYTKVTKEKCP